MLGHLKLISCIYRCLKGRRILLEYLFSLVKCGNQFESKEWSAVEMVRFGCVRWQSEMRMVCHSEMNLVFGNYLNGGVYLMKSDACLIVGIRVFLHKCTCVAYMCLSFAPGLNTFEF